MTLVNYGRLGLNQSAYRLKLSVLKTAYVGVHACCMDDKNMGIPTTVSEGKILMLQKNDWNKMMQEAANENTAKIVSRK